jgi:lipoate-protein ligase A
LTIPNLPDAYPRSTWRLIVQPPQDGATNMAIDEAIAERIGAGLAPPTLRFYAWEPACLSLGYAQPIADVDRERLRAQGWGIVRRLTGGRAILHIDEVTYSVAAPIDEPRVKGGVLESYRRLSQGLMAGLEGLGMLVQAERALKSSRGSDRPVCFEVPSDYEITTQGRKMLGSAQTRRYGTVLQHGALPLYGDITRICEALIFPDEVAREAARERVRERAITLEAALGERLELEQVAGVLAAGFARALNLDLDPAQLSSEELARAGILRKTKYASQEWTERH